MVAGTTLVTTLGEPLFYICRDSYKDLAPSGRTYKTDDLHFISLAPSVGTAFSHLGSKVWFQSIPKFRWSLTKILQH